MHDAGDGAYFMVNSVCSSCLGWCSWFIGCVCRLRQDPSVLFDSNILHSNGCWTQSELSTIHGNQCLWLDLFRSISHHLLLLVAHIFCSGLAAQNHCNTLFNWEVKYLATLWPACRRICLFLFKVRGWRQLRGTFALGSRKPCLKRWWRQRLSQHLRSIEMSTRIAKI